MCGFIKTLVIYVFRNPVWCLLTELRDYGLKCYLYSSKCHDEFQLLSKLFSTVHVPTYVYHVYQNFEIWCNEPWKYKLRKRRICLVFIYVISEALELSFGIYVHKVAYRSSLALDLLENYHYLLGKMSHFSYYTWQHWSIKI